MHSLAKVLQIHALQLLVVDNDCTPVPNPTCQMLVNTFPRELMDMIVRDMDKTTLAACTLVSHHWRISALPILFRNITAHLHFPDEPVREDRNSSPFCTFLASDASSNVTPLVKHLVLVGAEGYQRGHLPVERLDLILFNLPNLETFTFCSMHLSGCSTRAPLKCWDHPKKLKRVTIHKVLFSPDADGIYSKNHCHTTMTIPPSAFVQLLNMFAVVDRLDLTDIGPRHIGTLETFANPDRICWDTDHDLMAAASVSEAFRIKELNSNSWFVSNHADFLQLLWLSHGLHDLREVSLKGEFISVSRALFRVVGHRLTHLHIGLRAQNRFYKQSGKDRLGLSHCTMLSSLQYTMELSRSEPGDIPFISDALKDVVLHAPATLSQLRIHLTFELVYSSNRLLFVEGMPWGIIDAHLSTLPIPSVEVLFSNLDDLPSVEGPLFSQASALVKERLPRLMALKVLVVCQSFGQGWR